MKGVTFANEIKELIIKKVKAGESIDILATEYKIYPNTIRKWLALSGGISGVSSTGRNLKSNDLVIAKLNREKQELMTIIGELTVQLKKKL
jgi:transposase-like protein